MSKIAYKAGKFVAANRAVIAAVLVVLAVGLYFSRPGQPSGEIPPARAPGEMSPSEKLTAATLKGEKMPDPCDANRAQRMEKAKKLFDDKRFDEATNELYECIKSLNDQERGLYLKALTLGNEARAKIADAEAKALNKKKKSEGVKLGMTEQDVIDSSWGKPRKINRTTNKYGVREQWVYDGGYLYFEDGVLTSIQN